MNRLEYFLAGNTPKTKEALFEQLEFYFHAYLRGVIGSQEEKEFIKSLVKSKGGIVGMLQEIYGESIFIHSTDDMELDAFRDFLEDLSNIGKTAYESMSEQEINHWKYEGEIAVVIGAKHFFGNDEVRFQDIMRIETFFRIFLVNKFILLTRESEQKLDMQYQAYKIANMIRGELFVFGAKLEHIFQENIGGKLTQYLYILLTQANDISYEKANVFIEEIKMIDTNDFSLENGKKILELVSQALGQKGIEESTKTQVKNILLGTYNKKHQESFEFRLLPQDNFYFRKEEEMLSDDDIFPKNGTLYYEENTLQNVCIFHPNGKKVYWGDIQKSDYEKISGTYYVLDELFGWRNVPKYAKGNITSLNEIDDPHIQKVRAQNENIARQFVPKDVPYLLPEYIRTFALGKIEHGTYIENPKKISY